MEDDLWWKTTFLWKATFNGRLLRPMMEDDLWWKTTFDRRRPLKETTFKGRQPLWEENFIWKTIWWKTSFLLEEHYWWKMTIDGRQPLIEDILWWMANLDERQHLMEDDLWWKTTFDELRPSKTPKEDVLRWKTIFDGRRPSMQDNLWRTDMLSLRLPKVEFDTKDQFLFSFFVLLGSIWVDSRPPFCYRLHYTKNFDLYLTKPNMKGELGSLKQLWMSNT